MNSKNIYTPGSATAVNDAENSGDESPEKIMPFPIEHLPPAARAMAAEVARVERTPEPLAACCVLGFLSASIGGGLQVPSHPNKVARGNLFIMPSAKSGTGKSETFRPIAEPFFAYEREMVKHWETEILPRLLAEADLLESEIAKLKRDAVNIKPDPTRLGSVRDDIRDELKAKKKALADATAGANPPCLCCEDVTSQKLP